tara:strand:+ start:2323 stop:2970 length:648 start_codon:yes stop_codon:yes gene_type:complete
MKNSNIDNVFIYWLYFVSLILISIYILESFGFISGIFREDISYISSLIVSIFIFYLFRGGYYLYVLRNTIDSLDRNDLRLTNNIFVDILDEYKVSSSNNSNKKPFQEELKLRLYEIVDNGFFVADILLKLGIVGTVIGFIIMLSSLSTIDEMNLAKMNNLLLSMSSGMKVALYTTLSGLICSILLTIQNNFFENKINFFISKIMSLGNNEKKDKN